MKSVYVIGETLNRAEWGHEIPINHVVWFKSESDAVAYVSKLYEHAFNPLHFVQELNEGIAKEYLCEFYQGNVLTSLWWYITCLELATETQK